MLGQVSELVPLKQFCDEKYPKKNLKTDKARKAFVQEQLKLKLQKDPRTGVLCVPQAQNTVMMQGLRLSATRSKDEEFDDKEEAKIAQTKAKEGIAASTNSKDLEGCFNTSKSWVKG